MKQHMATHIATHQSSMFEDATTMVRNNINSMCEQARRTMHGRVQHVQEAISRDYLTILGDEHSKNRAVSNVEKTARRDIEDVINESEVSFREALECDLDQLASVGGKRSEIDREDTSAPLI